MTAIEHRSMSAPDETRTPDRTTLEVVQLGSASVARLTLQPGWRWSECIKPVVGGESCQAAHLGYLVTGQMHVVADDGAGLTLPTQVIVSITKGRLSAVSGCGESMSPKCRWDSLVLPELPGARAPGPAAPDHRRGPPAIRA